MISEAERFALAAERLVGTPFRLHGRSAEFGVDCVGLVACAFEAIGRPVPALPRYRMRNSGYDFVDHVAGAAALETATGPIRRGDLLMVRPGPSQRHLLVVAGPDHAVHAHAGLGKVVLMPGPINCKTLRHWRLQEEA